MRKIKLNESVSIVVLTYNSSKIIEKCLDSLNDQTNKNFEVLIVDDDSIDNTLNIVKKFLNISSFKIKILRNGKHNISRGRNIGIKNSKFRYVAFLDSDAYADKNWINELLKDFNKNPNTALVGGKEIQKFNKGFPKGISFNDYFTNKIAGDFWSIKGCNFAIDKVTLKGIFFNEKFTHNDETEFIERISKKFDFNYNKNAIVYHQPRTSPKKYLFQMYAYGYWRVLFSHKYNKFRLTDYYPLGLLFLSLILLFKFPILGITLIPIVCLIQSIIVLVYLKESIRYIPYSSYAWLIKNIGWGFGTLRGLLVITFKRNFINNLFYEAHKN